MKNKKTILVLGGCRSGKSSHALELAEKMCGEKNLFIATCVPRDDEMHQRVDRHKQDRSQNWQTLEIPTAIDKAITEHGKTADVILIDCLTLWVSNLLLESKDLARIEIHIENLGRALKNAECNVVLVSNEVGAGVVPENKLARLFRDAAGWTNQAVAKACDQVIMTMAGIPVQIKP